MPNRAGGRAQPVPFMRPPDEGAEIGSRRRSPEWLFAILALVGGIVLTGLIPPVGGGNERYNFHRAASTASAHLLVGPAPLPGGIAEFLEASREKFREGRNPPYSYSRADFDRMASIPLRADEPRVVRPNPIAVMHPISYLPQSAAIALGRLLGLSPLALFYSGRIAGLLAGIALTFLAIRTIPVHRHALAAVALLPPVLFTRSTLDADQFTVGLAFLFLALVIREIAASGRIARRTLAVLAAAAFILAQCKSAYLLLPLLSLAIPASRFGSVRAKALACLLVCAPGIVASAAWMIALKLSYFDNVAQYRTWSGIVRPGDQLQFVISDPLAYLRIVLATVFATPLVPKAILEFFGVFGPPVTLPLPFYPVAGALLAGVTFSGRPIPAGPLSNWRTRTFALALAAATILVILALLYLQWTRYRAPVIDGFQGRYLYPLIPLFLLSIPAAGRAFLRIPARHWLVALGLFSIAATWWKTWETYLA